MEANPIASCCRHNVCVSEGDGASWPRLGTRYVTLSHTCYLALGHMCAIHKASACDVARGIA